MAQTKTKMSATKRNLLIDMGMALVFLVALSPALTGLAIHEWLSVVLGGVLLTHMVLHWPWIVATTQRIFSKLAWQARLNYILNLLLLVAFTVVIGSGLMISEAVAPFLGLQAAAGGVWTSLHYLSSELIIWIAGLHVAVHWKWVVNAVQRYMVQPLRRRPAAVSPASGD